VAIAFELAELAVQRRDRDDPAVPLLDDSSSSDDLRRLIAHGIVRSLSTREGQPSPPPPFLFSVGFASGRTTSIPAPDLSELRATSLGGAGR